MTKKKILITSGPTVEPIDPARGITNFSTGTMGHAIAREAVKRGYKTVLISGPGAIPSPPGVKNIKIRTADEMYEKVKKELCGAFCLIMAAAVCDYKLAAVSKSKIKKRKTLTLKLEKNVDILEQLVQKDNIIKVGFALETDNLIAAAKKKLKNKRLDIIVANKKDKKNDPFGPGKKDVVIIEKNGKKTRKNKKTKQEIAKTLMDSIERIRTKGQHEK